MVVNIKAIGVLLMSATCCLAETRGYDPQPYTPIENSPSQLAEKQAALAAVRAEWTGDDFDSRKTAKSSEAEISEIASHFNQDGSWYKPLPTAPRFSDADYRLNKKYFSDLIALAYLDRAPENDFRQTIYQSLAWYFENGHAAPPMYHQTFNYHGPTATVGGQMMVLGLIMYDQIHADRLKDPTVETVFQNMRQYGRQFINAAPQIRGPNWSFRLENCLRYVLFTNDPGDMDEYQYHWNKALTFNRWETETDGVHPDWSMMHHGDMNYWGMYGIAWTNRVIEYGELFDGTPWAYKTEQLDFIANCMLEGVRWVLYRGNCEYTSAPKRGSFLLARTDSVAASFQELVRRLISLGGDQLSRRAELQQLADELILPPWSTENHTVDNSDDFAGHRYFWTTEYQVHRRPNFAIYTRRCSQRTRPPEDSSQKPGTFHLDYGTGYTPIMRRGDELRFSRLAWDFEKVPGTTVEQGCTVASGKAASTKRGLNLFSGGVDDGMHGCGAFDMQMVQFDKDGSGAYQLINGAGAFKGTFFFDDGMIALGQNIRRISPGHGRILTTLNNVIRQGDVVYSVDGASPKTISKGNAAEGQTEVSQVAWVWHDGIGYAVSGNANLTLSCGQQPFHERLKEDKDFRNAVTQELGREAWKKGNFDMFRIGLDHGVDPRNETYAYAVFPNCSARDMNENAASFVEAVRQNQNGVQVVEKDGIRYAVFEKPGIATFADGVVIKADRPLIVMARQDAGGGYVFHAANPMHRGLRRPFVPGTGQTIGELYEQPVEIIVQGFGNARSVSFEFPTERGNEGASVVGEVVQ